MVRCPAHKDGEPSLSVTPGRKVVLYHCFAGCSSEQILAALRAQRINPKITESAPQSAIERRDLTPLSRELWAKALPLPGTPAQIYLESRGIGHSTVGRYEPAAVTYEGGKKIRSRALFLPVVERGEIVTLTRIFLDADGRKNPALGKAKRMIGDPCGGSIQIGEIIGDHLNLAEGFEDAESVIPIFDLPGCWAVNGVEQYARLTIPAHVRTISIFSQHGHAAARALGKANTHLTALGRSVRIYLPPPGGDWNDAQLARIKACV